MDYAGSRILYSCVLAHILVQNKCNAYSLHELGRSVPAIVRCTFSRHCHLRMLARSGIHICKHVAHHGHCHAHRLAASLVLGSTHIPSLQRAAMPSTNQILIPGAPSTQPVQPALALCLCPAYCANTFKSRVLLA